MFRKIVIELVSKRNNLKTVIFENEIEINLYLEHVEKENNTLDGFKWLVEIEGKRSKGIERQIFDQLNKNYDLRESK